MIKTDYVFNEQISNLIYQFYTKYLRTHKNLVAYSFHLSNVVSIRSYILKAREIQKYLKSNSRILDWGAGFGHMTLILDKLGFDVVPYDTTIPEINLFKQTSIKPLKGTDPVKLPFQDNSFDAVLSCGVLEHVVDIDRSLEEIRRVLKDNGYFFIYNFPYKYSPSEYYATLKKNSSHSLKMTIKLLKKILKKYKFDIDEICYENGIPKNLNSPLKLLKPVYNKFPSFFSGLDKFIVKTPFLREVLSNSIKAISKINKISGIDSKS